MAEDVRARRAQRVKEQRAKSMMANYRWHLLGAVVLIAVVGTLVAFPGLIPAGPPAERFAHDHATFAVFINGERVNFAHPDYDASKRGMGPPHMHVSDGKEVWHIEGNFPDGKPDQTLEELFVYNTVTFRDGYMKLDTLAGHNGSEWRDQGNATWQVFFSKFGVDARLPFERVEGDPSAYVPQNLDQLLITYGDPTPEELARQQAAVAAPPGEPQPRTG